MHSKQEIPIITIDGPASSGKGSVARKLAQQLGFNYLESGVIYRALGLLIKRKYSNQQPSDLQVVELVSAMNLEFKYERTYLNNEDVTDLLRDEQIGMFASKYGALKAVRERLLQFQRDFVKPLGLVTDGRDMGSVVFPHARLKVFLTASAKTRAERRHLQLQQSKKSVTIQSVLQDILIRDEQDSQRSVAPLSYDATFKVLDNSRLTLEETVALILKWYLAT